GPWNGSWNKDDVIVFGRITSPLFRVSAAGGSPVKLTELDGTRHETAHFAPWFLPDGNHFLYVALSTDVEERRLRDGSRLQNAQAVTDRKRFDTGKLETTAEPVRVAEQADSQYVGAGVNLGYFSASQDGVLVYTSGRAPTGVQLTWFDRAGKSS